MIASGHPQKQAVAAALSNARRHPRAAGGLVNPRRLAAGGLNDSLMSNQTTSSPAPAPSTPAPPAFNPGAGIDYSPGGMPSGGYNNPTNPNFGNFDPSYIPGNTPTGGTGFPVSWQTPGQAQADATAQAFLTSIGAPVPMTPTTTAAGNISDWSANPFYAANPAYGMTPGYVAPPPPAAPSTPTPATAAAGQPHYGTTSALNPDGSYAPITVGNGISLSGTGSNDPNWLSPAQQRAAVMADSGYGQRAGFWDYNAAHVPISTRQQAMQTLQSAGWNPSMGYGQQNWAQLAAAAGHGYNPATADNLNRLLFGVSPQSQAEKNWTPPVTHSPEDVARMQRNYQRAVAGGGFASPYVGDQWRQMMQHKGWGELDPQRAAQLEQQRQQRAAAARAMYQPPPPQPHPQMALRGLQPADILEARDRFLRRRGGLV